MLDQTPLESSLEGYLVKRVKALGGKIVWKFVSPGTRAVPDRLIVIPAHPAGFLELKRVGEEPEPLQAKRIKDLREAGVVAGWASTRAMVDAFLEEVMSVTYCRSPAHA